MAETSRGNSTRAEIEFFPLLLNVGVVVQGALRSRAFGHPTTVRLIRCHLKIFSLLNAESAIYFRTKVAPSREEVRQ